MKKPTVSVIIPTYNSTRFLPCAVNSVLNQTFQDFELIIVDDNSEDNTKKVVKKMQKQDKRIRFFELETNSGGPAKPKNIGIKNSKGQYIAFLDHDDKWLPQKLEKQLQLFKTSNINNLGFVGCNSFNINKNNNTKEIFSLTKPKDKKDLKKKLLTSAYINSCSGIIVKKKIFKKVNLFDTEFKIFDDTDLWVRISQKYNFDFVNKPLFNYYMHQNNMSKRGKNLNKKIKDHKRMLNKYKTFFQNHPKYYSIKLRDLGAIHLLNQNIKGRQYFIKAIKIDPRNIKNCIYFIISLFGINFYNIIRKIKNI